MRWVSLLKSHCNIASVVCPSLFTIISNIFFFEFSTSFFDYLLDVILLVWVDLCNKNKRKWDFENLPWISNYEHLTKTRKLTKSFPRHNGPSSSIARLHKLHTRFGALNAASACFCTAITIFWKILQLSRVAFKKHH